MPTGISPPTLLQALASGEYADHRCEQRCHFAEPRAMRDVLAHHQSGGNTPLCLLVFSGGMAASGGYNGNSKPAQRWRPHQ